MSEKAKSIKEIRTDYNSLDIIKIQIYADKCHNALTSLLSFIFAYLIGLLAIFYSVLYTNLNFTSGTFSVTAVSIWLSGTTVTLVTTFLFLWITLSDYKAKFKSISEMIENVEHGKRLPELVDMPNKKETKTQKPNREKS